ncbi:MAG: hypothetical protein JW894_05440 [Bacteroidales bacterium]|nr:hypothetical protein [Bacteroidales bacterium]
MENQSPNFGKAILNALFIIFIYALFVLPWSIWIGAVKRFGSVNEGETFVSSLRKTEFMVFNYFKMVFDAIIVIIYFLAPIIAIIMLIKSGFSSFLGVLVGCYLSPIYLSAIKELLSIALVQVMKIEEIADNTKK